MKRKSIGELEELVLLTVGLLTNDAYGLAIQKELKDRCHRNVTISTVHAVITRLKDKGYLKSHYDGATPERGGRRKHLFELTPIGKTVISESREMRNNMFDAIGKLVLSRG